jgi:hypothetical protein
LLRFYRWRNLRTGTWAKTTPGGAAGEREGVTV